MDPDFHLPIVSTGMYANHNQLEEKVGRFRILVVGRAKAGKTTILRRVSNTRTVEAPEIFDDQGNKIDPSRVEHGVHDVEHEMIFGGNGNFVFHDSQGFEAGREDEFVKLKAFIADRTNTTLLKKRLHAIWYCIPMDDYVRGVTRAQEMFFNERDTGNGSPIPRPAVHIAFAHDFLTIVAVVVLFTKFDALLPIARRKLGRAARRTHPEQRLSMAKALVEQIFQEAGIWRRICQLEHVPNGYVCLEDLHKSNAACVALLEVTRDCLDYDAIKMVPYLYP